MKWKDFLTSFPYGAFNYNKALKDEILIGKNDGTYGSPTYGTDSLKGITIEEFFLQHELPLPSKVTLSAGQILAGNTTPIEIIPAVPGYFIDPLSFLVDYTAAGVAFDDPVGEMIIEGSGTGQPLFTTGPGFTNDFINKQIKMKPDILTSLPVITPNMALNAKFSSDSTVGGGEIIIYIYYRLVKQ